MLWQTGKNLHVLKSHSLKFISMLNQSQTHIKNYLFWQSIKHVLRYSFIQLV